MCYLRKKKLIGRGKVSLFVSACVKWLQLGVWLPKKVCVGGGHGSRPPPPTSGSAAYVGVEHVLNVDNLFSTKEHVYTCC